MNIKVIVLAIVLLFTIDKSWSKNVSYIVSKFKDLITTSLKQNNSEVNQHISEINSLYLSLPRSEMEGDDIIDIKLALQHWRMKIVSKYLLSFKNTKNIEHAKFSLKVINGVRLKLNNGQLETLHHSAKNFLNDHNFVSQYINFLARQAEPQFIINKLGWNYYQRVFKMAGPKKMLNVKPYKPSKYTFERWGQDPQYSISHSYQYHNGAVIYRNTHFRPGDVLINSLNHKGEGLYTSLIDPMGHFSHAVFFVILERNGYKYPAVLEIHEGGLRALPLNAFLSPKFTTYIEVYRMKNLSPLDEKNINNSALRLMKNVNGYNFYTEDTDTKYLTCTRVGSELFRYAGLQYIEPASSFSHPQIISNLEKLGFNDKNLLAPFDHALDPKMDLISVLDNNHFNTIAINELVLEYIRNEFEKEALYLRRFPLRFKFNRWAIDIIQNERPLAPLLRRVVGFSKKTFPKGPRDLMAIVEPLELIMDHMAKRSQKDVFHRISEEYIRDDGQIFLFSQIKEDEQITSIIRYNSRKFERLFN